MVKILLPRKLERKALGEASKAAKKIGEEKGSVEVLEKTVEGNTGFLIEWEINYTNTVGYKRYAKRVRKKGVHLVFPGEEGVQVVEYKPRKLGFLEVNPEEYSIVLKRKLTGWSAERVLRESLSNKFKVPKRAVSIYSKSKVVVGSSLTLKFKVFKGEGEVKASLSEAIVAWKPLPVEKLEEIVLEEAAKRDSGKREREERRVKRSWDEFFDKYRETGRVSISKARTVSHLNLNGATCFIVEVKGVEKVFLVNRFSGRVLSDRALPKWIEVSRAVREKAYSTYKVRAIKIVGEDSEFKTTRYPVYIKGKLKGLKIPSLETRVKALLEGRILEVEARVDLKSLKVKLGDLKLANGASNRLARKYVRDKVLSVREKFGFPSLKLKVEGERKLYVLKLDLSRISEEELVCIKEYSKSLIGKLKFAIN